jgi:hypothetical protein
VISGAFLLVSKEANLPIAQKSLAGHLAAGGYYKNAEGEDHEQAL